MSRNRDERILKELEKVALASDTISANRARLAACIVYKNNIVAYGINQMKSHPFQAKFSKNIESIFLHAETDCIKNSLRFLELDELSKSTLYICRIKYCDTSKKELIWGISKPCVGCQRAIATFNIRKVVYSCDGDSYKYL
jgi:deoxycytidylate deaminase